MIDPGHPRLSIVRQCELASISRSSFYREPTADDVQVVGPCLGEILPRMSGRISNAF